jgi:undecaprenyl phosphate N,N'-diacetylbacillosamine 1-phosphate transferase
VTPPPERAKRVLDLVVAVAALPVALPVIALLGLAVRLETKGGIFFRQTRVGQHGRHFRIFKLRTMVENAEQIGAGIYAEADDPRFTRVGTFARRFSLDELPQLFNVLRGEMSIVGPRPMLPVTVEL